METSEASIRAAGDRLQQTGRGFGGRELAKIDLLDFRDFTRDVSSGSVNCLRTAFAIQPALTGRFQKLQEMVEANRAAQNAGTS